MLKKTLSTLALCCLVLAPAGLADAADPVAETIPVTLPVPVSDACAPTAEVVLSVTDQAQNADNRPFGPLGPPPAAPENACEAQCVADFFQCQRICSRNPCLVSCEFLFDLCVADC